MNPALAHLPAATEHSGIREIGNEAGRTPGAIQLHVGQPNFPTPKHIGEAGKRAIDEGKTFYTHTQGLITLREKLVDKLERVNGIRVTPDRIAATPGGVGAIAAVFAAVLEPGDEVLLPDPGWPNTRIMLSWTNTRGVFYPCPPSNGFIPDLDELEKLITPRTKLLLINSPSNPTGAVFPRQVIERLIEIAQRHNLWLLSDECYDQILLDGEWTSPASIAPDDARIASVFTFSKTYSMTGWRLGYVAGSAELMDTVTKVLESNSSCVSTITQVAGEAALERGVPAAARSGGRHPARSRSIHQRAEGSVLLHGGRVALGHGLARFRVQAPARAGRVRRAWERIWTGGDGRRADQPGQLGPGPARGRRPAGELRPGARITLLCTNTGNAPQITCFCAQKRHRWVMA